MLEGLAHLPRQIGVRLCEHRAHAAGLKPTAWVRLALADLLETVADHLKNQYPDDETQGPPALE